jgi:hypothetical protein
MVRAVQTTPPEVNHGIDVEHISSLRTLCKLSSARTDLTFSFGLMSQRFGAPVQHSPYFIRLQGPHAAQRQVLRQPEPANPHALEERDFQPHVGDQLPHLQADAAAQHQACMLP